MSLMKKCRHGAAQPPGPARRKAWNECGCSWYADLRTDGARTYTPLGPDPRTARARHAQLVADREAHRATNTATQPPGRHPQTVAGALDAWMDTLRSEQPPLRPSTLRNYQARADVIRAWFGEGRLASVTTETVLTFFREAEGTYSPNYARDIRTTTGHLLAWCVNTGAIPTNPMPTGRRRKPAGATRDNHLPLDAVEAVIRAAKPDLAFMLEVAYLTGLRRGELAGLTWRDVDLAAGVVRVTRNSGQHGDGPPKTRASARPVRLSPRAANLLAGHQGAASDHVFTLNYWQAGEQLRALLKATGHWRPGRGFHSLRHANAALRDKAGESVRDAAAALGHGARHAQTLAYGWATDTRPADALDAARGSRRGNTPTAP